MNSERRSLRGKTCERQKPNDDIKAQNIKVIDDPFSIHNLNGFRGHLI